MTPDEAASLADDPFVSLRGRAMAMTMATLCVAIFGGVGLLLTGWSIANRVAVLLLGVMVGAGLLRWAALRAQAKPEGLWVRNLFQTRTIAWADLRGVRFTDGDAFAQIDLTDGDTVSVMAIQRADGERSRREAQRLADVIGRHQHP